MQLRVELHGLGPSGPFQENAYTVNVSRSGARLTGSRYSQHPGDTVELRRGKDKARFQVMWVGEPGTPVHGQVGVRSLEPARNIWSAPLPAPKPVAQMCPPTYPAEATSRPSISAFSEEAFTPSAQSAPAAPGGAETSDASGASLYTRTPFAAYDQAAPEESAEGQGDTMHYGPELTPEQYLVAHTPLPLHRRPILYVGLAAALIAGLGLGWLRSGSTPDEASTSSAEASAPAGSLPAPTTSGSGSTTPAQTRPALPPATTPAQVQPAPTKPAPTRSGSAPVQTTPAVKPATQTSAPKQKPAPVETASRSRTAPASSAPVSASAFAVQVGAYGSAATAQSLAKSLASRYDRKGIVDSVTSGGKTLHRVRLSSRSEADARDLVARIRREQKLDAIVVRPD
ncbi:MAG: SPOR domain-containing protein [Candidatus Acidiferrales bacterium]